MKNTQSLGESNKLGKKNGHEGFSSDLIDRFSSETLLILDGIYLDIEKKNIIKSLDKLKTQISELKTQKFIKKIIENIRNKNSINLSELFESYGSIKNIDSLYGAVLYIMENSSRTINELDLPIKKFLSEDLHRWETIRLSQELSSIENTQDINAFIDENENIIKYNDQIAGQILFRLKFFKKRENNSFYSFNDTKGIVKRLISIIDQKYINSGDLIMILGSMAELGYKDEEFIEKSIKIILEKNKISPKNLNVYNSHIIRALAMYGLDNHYIIDLCISNIESDFDLLEGDSFCILLWSLSVLNYENKSFIEKLKKEFKIRLISMKINKKNISQILLASHFYNFNLEELKIDTSVLVHGDYHESHLDNNVGKILAQMPEYNNNYKSQHFIEEIGSPVDFYFPSIGIPENPKGTILFMDGTCFHEIHNATTLKNEIRPSNTYINKVLEKNGYNVVRINSREWRGCDIAKANILKERVGFSDIKIN